MDACAALKACFTDGSVKIYSIWLCMDSPDGTSAINRYDLEEHQEMLRNKLPPEMIAQMSKFTLERVKELGKMHSLL